MNEVVVHLNAYEAVNLLRLLDALWNGHQSDYRLQEFNTGDWIGDCPRKLAQAMIEAGRTVLDQEPNAVYNRPTVTTREVVSRCAFAKECPHCGEPFVREERR